jgi:hypothetical protein
MTKMSAFMEIIFKKIFWRTKKFCILYWKMSTHMQVIHIRGRLHLIRPRIFKAYPRPS